ncbi:MAG: hypothetical protein AAF465_15035 [Pseudomonadota bacterium]
MNDEQNPYRAPQSAVDDRADGQGTGPITDIVQYRKAMIPLWIKVFGWLFLVFGALMPVLFIVSLITGSPVTLNIFGFVYHGPPLALPAMLLCLVFAALSVAAFGLLFAKDWGVKVCLVVGYLCLAMALTSTVVSVLNGVFFLRLEILFLVPYLWKLHKMSAKWHA